MKLKKILVFLAIPIFIFRIGSINETFYDNKAKTLMPTILENKIATVDGILDTQSGILIGDDDLYWVFFTKDNKIYSGSNAVYPGTKTPSASFLSYQTIVGYTNAVNSTGISYINIIVQEAISGQKQFVRYSFYGSGDLIRNEVIFVLGDVTEVTAVGMINMPDGTTYFIAAGYHILTSTDTVLTGGVITSAMTPTVFAQIVIPNTRFQRFSRFFIDSTTATTSRQKMYYTSNQYYPETGNWTYGYIGSLTFNIINEKYCLGANQVYSNATGSSDLRFAWYYDKRLLAWDALTVSWKVYWVDTAATTGVIFGVSLTPLLIDGVHFIFNKDGDSEEFIISGNTLPSLSFSFAYNWNKKKVDRWPTQGFFRIYRVIFGGQWKHHCGGIYGLNIDQTNSLTEIYRFPNLSLKNFQISKI